jgi:hypothetical protein
VLCVAVGAVLDDPSGVRVEVRVCLRALSVTVVSLRGLGDHVVAPCVFVWVYGCGCVCVCSRSLSNLKELSRGKRFSWLAPVVDASPVLTGLLTGYLPTIVLAIFMGVLPTILASK